MQISQFRLNLKEQFIIFVSTESEERLSHIGTILLSLGAKELGPKSFSAKKGEINSALIKSALKDLSDGECIYIVSASKDVIENDLLVATPQ